MNRLVGSRLLRVPLSNNPLDVLDNGLQRGAGTIIPCNPKLLQPRLVIVRNYSATHEQNIIAALLSDELGDLGKGRHVRAVEEAHGDHVNLLVDSHLRYLFRGCEETGVDDLHTCVAKGAAEDERASVVTIQPRFCD